MFRSGLFGLRIMNSGLNGIGRTRIPLSSFSMSHVSSTEPPKSHSRTEDEMMKPKSYINIKSLDKDDIDTKFGDRGGVTFSANDEDYYPDNEELTPDEIYDMKKGDVTRPTAYQYLRRLEDIVGRKRRTPVSSTPHVIDLQKLLQVFEVEMKEDLRSPGFEHFRIVILACAHAGYSEKAFQLYRSFCDHGLSTNEGKNQAIYAHLFHSVYKSPFPKKSFVHAQSLLRKCDEKGITLSDYVKCNAIKAFARCGDLETAFRIMDSIQTPNQIHFSHFLMACQEDSEVSFSLPTFYYLYYTFNLSQMTKLFLKDCKQSKVPTVCCIHFQSDILRS